MCCWVVRWLSSVYERDEKEEGKDLRSVYMCSNVKVLSATEVMTWIECSELSDVVFIRRLETTAKYGIDIALDIAVAISWCYNAAIYTCRIGMPEINHYVWNRFTGCDFDDLNVEQKIDSRLQRFFTNV